MPETWPPLTVRYREDGDSRFIRAEDDIERKTPKESPAEVALEQGKPARRSGYQPDKAVQLVQKTDRSPSASLRIPASSLVGVP
jgi:hypothetical protein